MGNILLEAFKALNESDDTVEKILSRYKSLRNKAEEIISVDEHVSFEDFCKKMQPAINKYNKEKGEIVAIGEEDDWGNYQYSLKNIRVYAPEWDAYFELSPDIEEDEEEAWGVQTDYQGKKYILTELELTCVGGLDIIDSLRRHAQNWFATHKSKNNKSLKKNKESEINEKIDLNTIHKDANASIENGTLKDAMGETLFKIGDLVVTGPHVNKGPYDFRNIKGTIDDVANFEGRNIYHIKALRSQKQLPYFEEDELIKVEENESGNLNEADTPKFAPREDVIKALNSKPGFEDFTENEISKLIGIYARDTGRWPSQVEKAEEFIDFLDDIGGWAGFVFSTFGIERGLSEKMLPKIIKKDPKLLQATKDYVTKYLHNPKMDKPLTKDEDYVEYILDYTPNRDGTNYEKTENLDWIEEIYKNPTKAFAELDKYKEKLSNVLKTTK